jgi:FkbM family methyltransferase
MLSQVMNAGHVLAFEPDPRNRALLEENLRLGGIADRAIAVPFALGDKDATVEFLADTESTQQGHIAGIRNADGTSHAPRLSVEERTIDSLVASGEYPAPDFIKIDVEGAEAMVLRGARQTLRDHAPVLAIELHGLEVRLPVIDELDGAAYVVYGYRTKTWRRLTRDDFKEVTSLYDPRHIYAAKDAGLLQKPPFIIELDGAKA